MPKKKILPKPSRKIKIIVYGDSPAIPTGFGTVIRNVFYHLAQTGHYDITIFGINDRGAWKDPEEHPYKVYQALPPGEQDVYGRSRFVDIMRGGGIDLKPDFDIVFFLNDPFVLENPIPYFNIGTIPAIRDIQKTHYTQLPPETWFKTVAYWPVDSPVKGNWIKSAIALVDRSFTYTKYGKEEIEKANAYLDVPQKLDLKIIPHGLNPYDFYPLENEVIDRFRQEYFQGAVRPETFLVTIVGRNQQRKDIPRAMKIFKEFQKRRPDSFLYIHAEDQEVWGSLTEAARRFDLVQNTDWAYPKDFTALKGVPREILNGIYNAADAHLTATQGEGWGLPLTEAMAVGTINIAPNITAIPEIFNSRKLDSIDNPNDFPNHTLRGIPIRSGTSSSEWIMHGATDLERVRPLVNVDDAVKKLLWVYDNPAEINKITRRAAQWINRMSWKKIATKWDTVFRSTFFDLERERQNPDKIIRKWLKMAPPPSRPHPETTHYQKTKLT